MEPLSGSCGYSFVIAVITAVASWMIAIIKGSHFFNFFNLFLLNFSPPFYVFIIPYIGYNVNKIITNFYKKKTLPGNIFW